jgi:hypothetical protein
VVHGLALTCKFPVWHSWEGPKTTTDASGFFGEKPAHTVHVVNNFNFNFNFFRDHKRQPIALGELLADAMRGLEMLQRRIVPADSRLPLLAPVALNNIMLPANTLRADLTWTPPTRPLLERFRACLAICVNYIFFLPRRNSRPLPDR